MRKRKNSRKSEFERTIIARISQEKYDELQKLLVSSRLRTNSELLRHILENRKIIVEHYDSSLDKIMSELSGIRNELHAMGVNINQITKRFHTQQWPEAMLANAQDVAGIYQQTNLQVQKLFDLIAKISQKWLPE